MQQEKEQGNAGSRKTVALVIFGVGSILALIAVFFSMQYRRTHVSTDDAFLDGRIHTEKRG